MRMQQDKHTKGKTKEERWNTGCSYHMKVCQILLQTAFMQAANSLLTQFSSSLRLSNIASNIYIIYLH